MIEIKRLTEANKASVVKVKLAPEQIKFSATAEDFLASGSATQHLHTIAYQNQIVGFFRLDIACPSSYEFCPENTLVLRKLAIDIEMQGKGLGNKSVKAMLPYIRENYPKIEFLYLTVNTKNIAAKSCYLKAGYEDTGKQFLGGPAGPQDIMFARVV